MPHQASSDQGPGDPGDCGQHFWRGSSFRGPQGAQPGSPRPPLRLVCPAPAAWSTELDSQPDLGSDALLSYFLAVWPWISHILSLSLRVLACNTNDSVVEDRKSSNLSKAGWTLGRGHLIAGSLPVPPALARRWAGSALGTVWMLPLPIPHQERDCQVPILAICRLHVLQPISSSPKDVSAPTWVGSWGRQPSLPLWLPPPDGFLITLLRDNLQSARLSAS